MEGNISGWRYAEKNKVYKINLHMVIWDAIVSIMTSL